MTDNGWSGYQGGCDVFEKLVGVPHVDCCSSCVNFDEGMEIYNDPADPWPNLPENAFFLICCTHDGAYKKSRHSSQPPVSEKP